MQTLAVRLLDRKRILVNPEQTVQDLSRRAAPVASSDVDLREAEFLEQSERRGRVRRDVYLDECEELFVQVTQEHRQQKLRQPLPAQVRRHLDVEHADGVFVP